MAGNKPDGKLTNRETDVLTVILGAGKPVVASDIQRMDNTLSINTVQAVLRQLLRKGLVEVAEIVYSGTVLCRSYRATELAKAQATKNFASQYKKIATSIPPSLLFANLLDESEDDDRLIEALEEILAKKKKESREG